MITRQPVTRVRLVVIAMGLALIASVGLPAQTAFADINSVAIQKSTSASGTQSPGASYTYTITATTSAAVDGLIVADGAFDYPQVTVTGVSYTLNGSGPLACGSPRPDNIRCPVGSVTAGTTVVATVSVTVESER